MMYKDDTIFYGNLVVCLKLLSLVMIDIGKVDNDIVIVEIDIANVDGDKLNWMVLRIM